MLSARADLVRLRGAEILRRVLLGLDYMHQQNVVHRDIKGVKGDLRLCVCCALSQCAYVVCFVCVSE